MPEFTKIFKKKKKTPEPIPNNDLLGLPKDMVYSMEPRHGHAQDVFDENNIRQVAGCLPIDPVNKRFLLVTSSSNPGTWVIPKGGWEKDETQQQAAMRETWEEAGVKGIITRHIGVFAEKAKAGVKAHHWIYEMEIKEVTKKFPEMRKRERRWFSYDEAMLVVKAHYIHDALAMSSLSPLVHPKVDSLQDEDAEEKARLKKEKKKEKKRKQKEEEEAEEYAQLLKEQLEKKEKKNKKKNKKASSEDDVTLTESSREVKKNQSAEEEDNSDDEEEEKKKKKEKKKNKKKGEIIELNQDEIPPIMNQQQTPLGQVDLNPLPLDQQRSNSNVQETLFEPLLSTQINQLHLNSSSNGQGQYQPQLLQQQQQNIYSQPPPQEQQNIYSPLQSIYPQMQQQQHSVQHQQHYQQQRRMEDKIQLE